MIPAAVLFLALLAGSSVHAQVTIRSGEHDTFTRLVFYGEPNADWNVASNGRSSRITLGNGTNRFDTTEVFSRIPRERLLDINSIDGGGVALELGCDCSIRSFQLNSRIFVVDIQDPVPGALSNQTALPDVGATPPQLPLVSSRPPTLNVVPPLGFADLSARTLTDQGRNMTRPATENLVAERLALIDSVERASAQKLLTDLTVGSDIDFPARTAPMDQAPSQSASDASFANLDAGNRLSNLRTVSPIDETLSDLAIRFGAETSGPSCSTNTGLDVVSWDLGENYHAELGNLRSQLYGEFDRIDTGAAERLAKLHIKFGMGAEAKNILGLVPETDVTLTLKAMAEIVETGRTDHGSVFSAGINCPLSSSVWSAIAMPQLYQNRNLDGSDLLGNFNGLPDGLKKAVGPALSRSMREAGRLDLAQDVIRILQRSEIQEVPAVELERSNIALDQGDAEEAKGVLADLAIDNTQVAPEALVRLIDLKIENGDAVDREDTELAAAYAHQLREAPIGKELIETHLLALASSGSFRSALDRLDEDRGLLSDTQIRKVTNLTFDRIAQYAPDVDFLEFVIARTSLDGVEIDASVENDIGERLIALGLAQEANQVLADAARGVDGERRQLLRAQAALLEQRPRNALAHLLGLENPDAARLRAEALASLELYQQASEAYRMLGNEAAMSDMALLARSESSFGLTNPGAAAPAAAADTDESTSSEPPIGLATSLELLSRTQETRDNVASLLNAYVVDSDE